MVINNKCIIILVGASVVFTLLHAIFMAPPISSNTTGNEELGIVMEDIIVN